MSTRLVLLADDESIIRLNQEQYLHDAGFRVLAAENGRECLRYFEREGAAAVAAVVLDYRMPVMDGLETFRRIRAIDAHTPIVICSGSLEELKLQELIEQGATAVSKPFTRAQFMDAIERAVA